VVVVVVFDVDYFECLQFTLLYILYYDAFKKYYVF